MGQLRRKFKLSSAQIIMLGFAGLILAGALLLMLPISSNDGTVTPFMDCLFTATSASCVTGLIVHDTATHWSVFGQSVLLVLIQIGGMGVVTVAVAITKISGKKISLMQRSTMQDAVSAHQVGGIVRFTGFIFKGILLIELAGALALMPAFIRDFGLKGVWLAFFHSISAFCNAGFDLLGRPEAKFVSLTGYMTDPLVNIPIILLILLGGLGFLTWRDVRENGIHLRRYRMQSKVILALTGVLVLLPTLYFFFFEFSYMPLGDRILASLFQAVTPRTAGFNMVDLTTLSETGQILMALLMLLGGAPGSTAGGMKITTMAVLVACAVAVFRRREHGQFFGRRIADETVKNAVTVFIMYVALFFVGGLLISRLENLPLVTCLFESASAVGTVGLTLGITPQLGVISRVVLICLMFFGRIGGLTLIFATLPAQRNTQSKLPLDKISVG